MSPSHRRSLRVLEISKGRQILDDSPGVSVHRRNVLRNLAAPPFFQAIDLLRFLLEIPGISKIYDFIVIDAHGAGNVGSAPRRFAANTYGRLFNWLLIIRTRSLGVGLVVLDFEDHYTINPINARLLRACDLYLKRELAADRWRSMENLVRFRPPSKELREIPWVAEAYRKLRPISLGLDLQERRFSEYFEGHPPGQERKHDVFISYATEDKPIRYALYRAVEKLSRDPTVGLSIFLSSDLLSYEEYFETLAASRACFSLSGYGWDCYRHYEAIELGCCPIINYPDIDHVGQLVEGENCVFVDPLRTDRDSVLAAIRRALEVHRRMGGAAHFPAGKQTRTQEKSDYILGLLSELRDERGEQES